MNMREKNVKAVTNLLAHEVRGVTLRGDHPFSVARIHRDLAERVVDVLVPPEHSSDEVERRERVARAIAAAMDEDFDRLEMGKDEMLRAADAAIAAASSPTSEER